MLKTKEPYRHELKYIISTAEKESLKLRLGPVLSLDAHAEAGGYMIRSLYFDDYFDSAYVEKDMGILARKKYRIRLYNCSDRGIKLERKRKVGSYIYKEAAPLTRRETELLLEGEYGFLLESPHSLCREFYVECVCHVMRPRVIVDYEREPYVMDAGTVRLTFDSDVRAAVLSRNLFDASLPSLPVLEPGTCVMEVKYTEFLPQLVKNILPPRATERTALSKYGLCCEKTLYSHGWGYWQE